MDVLDVITTLNRKDNSRANVPLRSGYEQIEHLLVS